MRKKIIHISQSLKLTNTYKQAFEELERKYDIEIILFSQDFSFEIHFLSVIYKNFEDIYEYIQSKKIYSSDIIFINTFDELLVEEVNTLRKRLGITTSENISVFRNKSEQRRMLKENFPESTTFFKKIDITAQKESLFFPCVIKPINGVQSSWVELLSSYEEYEIYKERSKVLEWNMKERWIWKLDYIIEEYIQWDMYTLNYFVNSQGEIFYTPLVKVLGVQKLWINDFSNYCRISGKKTEKEIPEKKWKEFVEKTVKALELKNTFIHHEFKYTPEKELKTIEINGRIGGYRLEIIRDSYDFNLLSLLFHRSITEWSLTNIATFVVYADRRWILKAFNNTILNQIWKLKSFSRMNIKENMIGKEVWFTKDWFTKLAIFKIENKNFLDFQRDYNFIEDNYKNILILW